MDSAELALASSLQELVKQQDAISNNLANINSTAFKRRSGTFEEFEIALDNAQKNSLGAMSIPRYFEQTDYTQGDFSRTDDPLNVALIGPGFLKVKHPDGTERFTRDGGLNIGPNGTLMTHNGLSVLDAQGQEIGVGSKTQIKITTQGELIDTNSGDSLGRIGLWSFKKAHALMPRGGGLYAASKAAGAPTIDRKTQIRQGGLERSNVNSVSELVSMITVQRHHGAVAKALRTVESVHDQLIGLARG